MLTKSLLKKFFGFALLLCANLLQAQPGTLDPTFGSGGRVLLTIPGNTGMDIRGLANQADGKLVGAGYYSPHWMIARYNPNGTLDNTFGVNGLDTSSGAFAFGSSAAFSVAIQSDGKIVAGGVSNNASNLTVVRYNIDGSFDNSFGTKGIVTISTIPEGSFAKSIAIQNDGKILAGGGYYNSDGNGRFLLARLNTNGNFDPSFGINGIVPAIVIGPTNDDAITSLTVQADSKIIAAGYSQNTNNNHSEFVLSRYKINGVIDSTFGTNGIVTTSIMTSSFAESVALQSDQKIVVSGSSYNAPTNYFALTRYNTDGTLDNGFGIQTLAVDGGSQAFAMELQNDGKIIEAGSLVGGRSNFAMARYLSTGVLDNSFGVKGVDTTSMGSQNGAIAYAIRLTNSRIYLGGTTGNSLGIAAYTNDAGPLPVILLNFDGTLKNGNALLTWSTANEFNNKGFEVQKSMDGQTFTDIDFVAGHGNSSQVNKYDYTDVNVLSGSNYYRLKQIDLDGNYVWSNIVHVTFNTNQLITFMPNPAKSFITISSAAVVKQIRLLSVSGQIIKVWQNVSPNAQLDLGTIASGAYLIEFMSGQSVQTMKLVKK